MLFRRKAEAISHDVRQTASEINAVCLIAFLKFSNQLEKGNPADQEIIKAAQKKTDTANDLIDATIKAKVLEKIENKDDLKAISEMRTKIRVIIDKTLKGLDLTDSDANLLNEYDISQDTINKIAKQNAIIDEQSKAVRSVKKLKEPTETKESVASTQTLMTHIQKDIGMKKNPKSKAKAVEYWSQVMKTMMDDGNYFGAKTVHLALSDSTIVDDKITKRLPNSAKANMNEAREIFTNKNNLINAMQGKLSSHHPVIPPFSSESAQLVQRATTSDVKGWNAIIDYVDNYTTSASEMTKRIKNGPLVEQLMHATDRKFDSADSHIVMTMSGENIRIGTSDFLTAIDDNSNDKTQSNIRQLGTPIKEPTVMTAPPIPEAKPEYIGPRSVLTAKGMQNLCNQILNDLQMDPNKKIKKALNNAISVMRSRSPVLESSRITASMQFDPALLADSFRDTVLGIKALRKEFDKVEALKSIINDLEKNGAKPDDIRRLSEGFNHHLKKMLKDADKLEDTEMEAKLYSLFIPIEGKTASNTSRKNVDLDFALMQAKQEREKFLHVNQDVTLTDKLINEGIRLNDNIIIILQQQRDQSVVRGLANPDPVSDKGKEEANDQPTHEKAKQIDLDNEIQALQDNKKALQALRPKNIAAAVASQQTTQPAAESAKPTLKQRWENFVSTFKNTRKTLASAPKISDMKGTSTTQQIARAIDPANGGAATLKETGNAHKETKTKPAMEPVETNTTTPSAEESPKNEERVTHKRK